MSLAENIPTPKPPTAGDMRACIQAHFGTGGDQYAVLFEVRNGTAWRANRSVDAVVMSLWPSLGMELVGMHGTMTGDMRAGPVTITIFDGAPSEAKEALAREFTKACGGNSA